MTLVMVSKDRAVRRTIVKDGQEGIVVDYFGKSSGNNVGPEAFVVELVDQFLGAHFHPVDQFQILLGNPGSFYRRQPVPRLMVHYADAYTTYGPLHGATPSLRFFTLRGESSNLTGFMPKDRGLLAYRGRRNLHSEPEALTEPLGAGDSNVTTLFESAADGFGALLFIAGPGGSVTIPSSVGSSGQYVYVADGSVSWMGSEYGEESLGWLPANDDAAELQAGPDGCRVVVMRLPYPSTKVSRGEFASAAPAS